MFKATLALLLVKITNSSTERGGGFGKVIISSPSFVGNRARVALDKTAELSQGKTTRTSFLNSS